MEQELVISKSIINFLAGDISNYFDESPQKESCRIIKQNYVCLDEKKELLLSYHEEIQKQPASNLIDNIKSVIAGWASNSTNVKLKKIECAKDILEIELTKATDDRIYFHPDLTAREIKQVSLKYPEIEAHNIKTFLCPEPNHRLKHNSCIIPLEEGVYYNLPQILEPYLRNALYIKIKDPFLPNSAARHNLECIISKINKKAEIELIYYNKKLYSMQDKISLDGKSASDTKIKEHNEFGCIIDSLLSSGYRIKLSDYKYTRKGHIERFIYTDKFDILIPGGLDCIDIKGFWQSKDTDNEKKKAAIVITPK